MSPSVRFSIVVPTYNTDLKLLDQTIQSVIAQTFRDWELCICDDASPKAETVTRLRYWADKEPRIKLLCATENAGIAGASNQAAQLATGDYMVLLDHDDLLTPDALSVMNQAILDTGADMLYSDEDKLNEHGLYIDPAYKPDYSPETLLSSNYICHLLVFKRQLFEQVGGFHAGFDGAQDYDLILRLVEQAQHIHHVPKILYHWRIIPGSTAESLGEKPYAWEAGKRALEAMVARRGYNATVHLGPLAGSYRVQFAIKGNPLVSILIPFRDRPDLLDQCLSSLTELTTYQNWEVLGINNGSIEPETLQLMKSWRERDSRIRFIDDPAPFNYPRLNNDAAKQAQGEYIVLMNNDIKIIEPTWLECLLEYAQQPDIGAVGAKLLYYTNTVQHAGVIIGLNGLAGHCFRNIMPHSGGYLFRAVVVNNMSAVTAALLMVHKDKYREVDGMDAENLPMDFNDVDFCLRLLEKGYRNVLMPFSRAFHYEGQSIGDRKIAKSKDLKSAEGQWMRQRHAAMYEHGDPCYNINLGLDGRGFEPKTVDGRLVFKTKLGKQRRLLVYFKKPCRFYLSIKTMPVKASH